MENLKNFAFGRLNAVGTLEDKEDMKALYNQVLGLVNFLRTTEKSMKK